MLDSLGFCMCHEVKRHELAESSIAYGIMATTVSLLYALYLYREVSDILQKLHMVDVQPVEILLRSGTWMFVYSVYSHQDCPEDAWMHEWVLKSQGAGKSSADIRSGEPRHFCQECRSLFHSKHDLELLHEVLVPEFCKISAASVAALADGPS